MTYLTLSILNYLSSYHKNWVRKAYRRFWWAIEHVFFLSVGQLFNRCLKLACLVHISYHADMATRSNGCLLSWRKKREISLRLLSKSWESIMLRLLERGTNYSCSIVILTFFFNGLPSKKNHNNFFERLITFIYVFSPFWVHGFVVA